MLRNSTKVRLVSWGSSVGVRGIKDLMLMVLVVVVVVRLRRRRRYL